MAIFMAMSILQKFYAFIYYVSLTLEIMTWKNCMHEEDISVLNSVAFAFLFLFPSILSV